MMYCGNFNTDNFPYLNDIVKSAQWTRTYLQHIAELLVIIKNFLEFLCCKKFLEQFRGLSYFSRWQGSFHLDQRFRMKRRFALYGNTLLSRKFNMSLDFLAKLPRKSSREGKAVFFDFAEAYLATRAF